MTEEKIETQIEKTLKADHKQLKEIFFNGLRGIYRQYFAQIEIKDIYMALDDLYDAKKEYSLTYALAQIAAKMREAEKITIKDGIFWTKKHPLAADLRKFHESYISYLKQEKYKNMAEYDAKLPQIAPKAKPLKNEEESIKKLRQELDKISKKYDEEKLQREKAEKKNDQLNESFREQVKKNDLLNESFREQVKKNDLLDVKINDLSKSNLNGIPQKQISALNQSSFFDLPQDAAKKDFIKVLSMEQIKSLDNLLAADEKDGTEEAEVKVLNFLKDSVMVLVDQPSKHKLLCEFSQKYFESGAYLPKSDQNAEVFKVMLWTGKEFQTVDGLVAEYKKQPSGTAEQKNSLDKLTAKLNELIENDSQTRDIAGVFAKLFSRKDQRDGYFPYSIDATQAITKKYNQLKNDGKLKTGKAQPKEKITLG
jgi:hypothetical protein